MSIEGGVVSTGTGTPERSHNWDTSINGSPGPHMDNMWYDSCDYSDSDTILCCAVREAITIKRYFRGFRHFYNFFKVFRNIEGIYQQTKLHYQHTNIAKRRGNAMNLGCGWLVRRPHIPGVCLVFSTRWGHTGTPAHNTHVTELYWTVPIYTNCSQD